MQTFLSTTMVRHCTAQHAQFRRMEVVWHTLSKQCSMGARCFAPHATCSAPGQCNARDMAAQCNVSAHKALGEAIGWASR